MVKVTAILENDQTWTLPAWERALPRIKRAGHAVEAIWTCPKKLPGLEGSAVCLYYLNSFGLSNFVKLGLFAALAASGRLAKSMAGAGSLGFGPMCRKNGVRWYRCAGPNDPAFFRWTAENEIDVVVTMVNSILEDAALKAPRIGTVNKHAALLPANKGLFPYFWAKLKGQEQGISFHVVTDRVDSGDVLVQETVSRDSSKSMIDFYVTVQHRFPDILIKALDAIVAGGRIVPSHGLSPSYHGLPGRQEYGEFKKRGGRIIRMKDIPSAWKL